MDILVCGILEDDTTGVPPSNIDALGTDTLSADRLTITYESQSTAESGETLNLVRFTITFAGNAAANNGAGYNDGRVIVIEGAGHAATPQVISDTGGTPNARLTVGTDPNVTGTMASFTVTSAMTNDLVGSNAASIYVEDTGGNNDTGVVT